MSAISVIIPVLRETRRIGPLIRHLRGLEKGGGVEIIVVDGDRERSTVAAITDADVVTLGSAKGRAVQMNAGAAVARGNTLLFLHADTRLPEDGLPQVSRVMAAGRYVGGSFGFRFDSGRWSLRLLSRIATVRARLSRVPFGDHAIFLDRRYFSEIGGYRPIPIMEDVELMRRIKKLGGRIRILEACALTSARRLEREGLLYCMIRNSLILALYFLGVSPERLKRYYPDGDDIDGGWEGRLQSP